MNLVFNKIIAKNYKNYYNISEGVIYMSIVVFGGSFNPPLNSHFSIAQQVLNQFEEVEKIVFIPVNKKYPKQGLLDNKHRYNMLKLVADKNGKFEISDMDMCNEKSLPTIETLEEMKKIFCRCEMYQG